MSQTDDHMIERYLLGELSAEEKEQFLKRLEEEPELAAQLKLEQDLRNALDDKTWAYAGNKDHPELKSFTQAFGSEEAAKLKQSITKASESYHQSEKPGKRPIFRQLWIYTTAAAAMLVVSILLLRPKEVSAEALYAEYMAKTELPDPTTRSGDDFAAEVMRAQALFNNGEYKEASAAFEKILRQEAKRADLYINLAVAQVELAAYDQAIISLEELTQSNLLDAPKGYWYQSLVYLKAGETDKCKELLQTIIDNRYYNHKLAAELLSDL